MKGIKSGPAFHGHHDTLVGFCYDYDGRVEYIVNLKPREERELRLRLFKLIPEEKIPGRDSEEFQAITKAWEAQAKAWEAQAKAWETQAKVWEAQAKAVVAYTTKFKEELEKLHNELCPNCPWDGETIFTRRNKKGEWC